MKDKLRELAERWSAKDPVCEAGLITITMNQCAAELLEILDAEGDGGAVAYICHKCNKALTGLCSECAEKKFPYEFENTHPARSGVVSDEDVRDAERYRFIRASPDQSGPRITTWNDEINAPMYPSPNLADALIDAAIQGERHER